LSERLHPTEDMRDYMSREGVPEPSGGRDPQWPSPGSLTSSFRREAYAANAAAARTVNVRKRAYIRSVVITDIVLIVLSVLTGFAGRFQGIDTGSEIPYELVVGGLMVGWILMLVLNRCYDDHVLGYGPDEYRRVVGGSLKLAGAIAILAYLFDFEVARGFLALSFLAGIAVLPIGRYLNRHRLHRARYREKGWSRRVLVVGDASHVIELSHQLRKDWWAGYHVVGACIPEALIAPVPQHLDNVPVVGSFRNILEAAAAVSADTVAVTGSAELTARRLRRLGWQMEGTGIDLVLAPTLTDVAGPRIHTRPVAGLPLIHVESPEFRGVRKALKGIFDRLVAAIALLFLSPILIALAVAVAIDSKGPVVFRQTRVGMGGREFDVLKFRSMVVDADAMLQQLSEYNEGDGLLFKMKRDPRVTRVGAVLRKWSLDELPQLVNVFKGDMSLVGPRPPLPTEVAWYDQDVARRLLVKPGMTGLWQVSGRSDLSWEDGIRLDLYYVENWSLATDLTILWKTVGAVLFSKGAY
jgi:exopolysaccharide biosynthesis polyprenyl glycosylphosphotransferase